MTMPTLVRAAGLGLIASLTAVHAASCAAVVQPKTIEVVIQSIGFGPAEVTVRAGDTIAWVNKDPVDHTATERSAAWDLVLPAGQRASLVMRQTGTFEYYCRYHPNMQARLVVTPR